MIKKVELENFKRFSSKIIDFHENSLSLLVGGNNSGKSTLLHALAVWEYCKTVLIYEKSPNAIFAGFHGDGYGINIDDFTPINIPSLKYLWTNLSPSTGYNLSINCFWNNENGEEKFLKIGLALTQERLFIKPLESNILIGEKVPRIAYLPPFAGISDKEQWFSPAFRNKLIGQGLAGAVLRNTIIDLYNTNQKLRIEKKGTKSKISKVDLEYIRRNDAFEILNSVLFDIFKGIIEPQYFNPDFHTNIKVNFVKGEFINSRFTRFPNYNKRDIMVEGSGFLQWLSVYTFAINPSIDVLLLDEPDAHLHNSLQGSMVDKLEELSIQLNKQILIATHSTEVVKNVSYEIILHVNNSIKYLSNESQKIKVLSGLGSEFFPRLDSLQRHKRILFVENKSDAQLLKMWTTNLQLVWPENLVIWPFANDHKERKQLFIHLKDEIKGIQCISIVDRDNSLYENTNPSLKENYDDIIEGQSVFMFRKWRRWEIENYLICPAAISRIVNKEEQEIRDYLQQNHGVVINDDYLKTDKSPQIAPLFEEGKPIIEGICDKYSIKKIDIAREMKCEEIFEDIKTLIAEIISICE